MSLFAVIRRALFGPSSSPSSAPDTPVAAPPADTRGEPPASTSDTYLSEEEAAFYLVRDERGRLPVTVSGGWFLHDGTGKRVGPANRALTKAGVYSFNVRGDNYRDDEVTAADTRPGVVAALRREPENRHDKNAILVLGLDVDGGERMIGYVNKGLARSLARRLDGGDDLGARFMRGDPAGRRSQRVAVVVTDSGTMRNLFGR
ncbi:HIRAN domain-containing protein [Brachybacterium tyrofermentans]|uniref:HIRAN domain-containing protein n=1 Tax=Brachybacterium tyrofermentans TaxID=47848 RepID=UPI003F93309E